MEPGKHGIGPSLAGIWGEKAGDVPGYEFSQPMKDSGLTWNQAGLDRYLADPRGTVPGTKMAFGGVSDAAKRQAIIDYIRAN
jgi:cytochrome c2